ncbi:hypothetical protein [Candidatus Sororendozoicomonas aggregata]|uniref:hypothetical protein n=1 Tax=Candidatus Sororendozoicomonas aggregata TaxID=3073239 RepID=UPI002ED2CE15
MAYGYSNGGGLSGSRHNRNLQNQVSEHLLQPGSSGASASIFNSRTVTAAPYYQCHISGSLEQFDTLDALLSNRYLLRNFKRNIDLYCPGFDISLSDREIKEAIVADTNCRQCFLLINDIDTINPVSQSQTTNERVPEMRGDPINASQIVYNSDRSEYENRFFTFTSGRFRRYLRDFRTTKHGHDYRNSLRLAEAGFYFSPARKEVRCYCCGGVVRPELVEASDNVLQMHGKFYPQCNYLLESQGQAFIDDCQARVTFLEQSLVAQPLPDTPKLYQQPVSEGVRHRDEMEFQSDDDRRRIYEGQIHGIGSEVWDRRRERRERIDGNDNSEVTQFMGNNTGTDCNTFIENLRGKISGRQLDALQKLHRKIQRANFGREEFQQSFAQILQSLGEYPDGLLGEIAEEITATINAAEETDCQDHTSEIIDQIKTRMLFVALSQDLNRENRPFSLLQLLCKLKLFFNESVLFKTLGEIRFNDGTPLIASRESTEIRGYVKNHLAETVCKFPENHITQRYSTIGQLPYDVMERFKYQFLISSNNQADFINYLQKILESDSGFLNFIKQHDENFSVSHSKAESNAELLMESLNADFARETEQELLEEASNVAQTRQQWLEENIEEFVNVKVREHWYSIVMETSM